MEIKEALALLSSVFLIVCGVVYGLKYVRGRKNYLLGFEWLIVAFSASNLLVFLMTGWEVNYSISFFLDAFSRAFGVPIVAVLGLMAVTHDYKPSVAKDIMIFAVTFAATFVLVLADFAQGPLPYFYLFMWSCYTLYLAYFTWRLLRAGESLHALLNALLAVAGLVIAIVYDFFPIPGDDDKMVFMIYALAIWGCQIVQQYYAYGALERAKVGAFASLMQAR
ncbi:hypothetical protein ACM79C_06425 [Pseudomonas aeruginosa]|uniref:hypothetical protein n=1 Tax=Pseudomonas aeruginosa TaxID=287 RepID=UPI001F3A3C6F|nr:hypothetical protein [Pseudomonas aeruginosa]MDG4275158.1 hypothetical protein [Pseudomonas aeruginosa]HBO3911640.1 hypothetical protein [Pseudomonas aeruginosa]HCF5874563.1 hypothetical protein [Pseudomonas aeruginosa]